MQALQGCSDYLLKKNILITSDQQRIDAQGCWHAIGNLSVFWGNQIHIFADRMKFDQKNQKIFFYADQSKRVKIIRQDLHCLMKQLICDLTDETCFADQVQGFYKKCRLYAESARIFLSGEIELSKISFTSCHKKDPHWQFFADRAEYTLDQKLVVRGVSGQWGTWLKLPLPIKQISYALEPTSGFLFPSFYCEKRSGYGFKIPYYWYCNDDIDLKYLLQFYSQKGVALQQRVRFFYPSLSGTFWLGYGSIWGYDDGIALTRLDREPFFLQGDLVATESFNNGLMVGFASAYEGIDYKNTNFFFDGAFWKDRRTDYRAGISFSDQKFVMSCCFEAKKYAVTESFIKNEKIALEVKKTDDFFVRLPAILWWHNYFSDAGNYWVQPRCLVDALFYKKDISSMLYQSINVVQYYLPGEKNRAFEDVVLRARPTCEAGLIVKTREQIFIAQANQGLFLYGFGRQQSQQIKAIPFFSFEGKWVFPELLCSFSKGFMRSHTEISFLYQPFFEQKNDHFKSLMQQGYDGEDYRYQKSVCWIKQQYQLGSTGGSGLIEWQQGIDWSNQQWADRQHRFFSTGLSFPWRCLIAINQKEAGYSTDISGEWGERDGFLHQGIMMVWKEYKVCRLEGKYLYVNPALAALRGLHDIGHFGIVGLTIRSGRGFKGVYQGSWGIDIDNKNQKKIALRSQSMQICWTFDCWRLGIGAEYQSYRIASSINNFWRALFSFQLLFF